MTVQIGKLELLIVKVHHFRVLYEIYLLAKNECYTEIVASIMLLRKFINETRLWQRKFLMRIYMEIYMAQR